MKTLNKFFALIISAALAVSLLVGCGASSSSSGHGSMADALDDISSSASLAASSAAASEEAQASVQFTVTGADGTSTTTTLTVTDGEKLSDALAKAGIISQKEADAGYVTVVNGEEADWNDGQAWWCLTDASGEATTVGIADIELHDGDSYAFTFTHGM